LLRSIVDDVTAKFANEFAVPICAVTDKVFAELTSSVAVPNTADVHAVTLFD
jgi:hypothetical protein